MKDQYAGSFKHEVHSGISEKGSVNGTRRQCVNKTMTKPSKLEVRSKTSKPSSKY